VAVAFSFLVGLRTYQHPCNKSIINENSKTVIFIVAFPLNIAALLVGRLRDRSPVVSLGIFSVDLTDKTMCPEVDSASENEYQEFLLG